MRIFKFGGTSIRDASHIVRIAKILKSEGTENLVMVVSAMGKMTNAFESLIPFELSDAERRKRMRSIRKYHDTIIEGLEIHTPELDSELDGIFDTISGILKDTRLSYDCRYDRVVSYGEIISSLIIHTYLSGQGIPPVLLDARKILHTDGRNRKAQVLWKETCRNIREHINAAGGFYLTQGFIGGSERGTVTLGREGSDYTAAVFGYCTDASSVTIWKDVPGVYNADPRYFDQYRLLDEISYNEALEMAFYGASIIHPKTIKPLQNKNIPLYVRSFLNSNNPGSKIASQITDIPVPRYILKKNQILLSIATRDFSFIIEKHISRIFDLFARNGITVNLIQNSAISFSVCLEDPLNGFERMIAELQKEFYIRYNKHVSLLTIRHIDEQVWDEILEKNKVLLSQKTGKTAQFVISHSAP